MIFSSRWGGGCGKPRRTTHASARMRWRVRDHRTTTTPPSIQGEGAGGECEQKSAKTDEKGPAETSLNTGPFRGQVKRTALTRAVKRQPTDPRPRRLELVRTHL
jgi:hypothetical protein